MTTVSRMVAEARAANRGKVGIPFWRQNHDFKETDNVQTVEDAIKTSQLDYDVAKRPIFLRDENGELIEAPGKFALARVVQDKDGKNRTDVYGVVGQTYSPVQNVDKFKFFNPYLESGQAQLVAAGSLDNGEKTVIVAKLNLPDTEIVTGDILNKYLIISDAFDGKSSLKINLMVMRLICSNGAVSATNEDAQRLRHNKNTVMRIEDIQRRMEWLDNGFAEQIAAYKLIASKPVPNQDALTNYFKAVFEFPAKEVDGALRLSTRAHNTIDDLVARHDGQRAALEMVHANFEDKTNTGPLVRGSYWAAYNAVTEYLNHERGHNHSTRVNNLLFGTSAKMERTALQLAMAA